MIKFSLTCLVLVYCTWYKLLYVSHELHLLSSCEWVLISCVRLEMTVICVVGWIWIWNGWLWIWNDLLLVDVNSCIFLIKEKGILSYEKSLFIKNYKISYTFFLDIMTWEIKSVGNLKTLCSIVIWFESYQFKTRYMDYLVNLVKKNMHIKQKKLCVLRDGEKGKLYDEKLNIRLLNKKS